MTIVVVAFHAKPGKRAELVAWLRENQPKLPAFEGFRSITLTVDEADPDRVVEIERWDSAANHRAMVETVAVAGGWDALEALAEGDAEVTYLEEVASSGV